MSHAFILASFKYTAGTVLSYRCIILALTISIYSFDEYYILVLMITKDWNKDVIHYDGL